MKTLSKYIFLVAAFLVAVIAAPTEAHADDIGIIIDDRRIEASDAEIIIVDGRAFAPIDFFNEHFDMSVTWFPSSQFISIWRGAVHAVFWPDADHFVVQGRRISLDVPAQIIDDNIMLPICAVLVRLDHFVIWEEGNRAIRIISDSEYFAEIYSQAMSNHRGREFIFHDLDGDGAPELIVIGHVHRLVRLPIPTAIYAIRGDEVVALNMGAFYEWLNPLDSRYGSFSVLHFINTDPAIFIVGQARLSHDHFNAYEIEYFHVYVDGNDVRIDSLGQSLVSGENLFYVTWRDIEQEVEQLLSERGEN